jgi:hypothetical protein
MVVGLLGRSGPGVGSPGWPAAKGQQWPRGVGGVGEVGRSVRHRGSRGPRTGDEATMVGQR